MAEGPYSSLRGNDKKSDERPVLNRGCFVH